MKEYFDCVNARLASELPVLHLTATTGVIHEYLKDARKIVDEEAKKYGLTPAAISTRWVTGKPIRAV